MFSNVSVNQNLPNKLLSCLYTQKKTGKFCDIVLNVGGSKFSVHSCVLASFSPYFNDILLTPPPNVVNTSNVINSHIEALPEHILEQWSLRNPLHLTLPVTALEQDAKKVDCSDCTAKVLDFMYLGKIQIQKEHVEHVKLLSTILQVSELILICEKYSSKYKSFGKRKSEFYNEDQSLKKQKEVSCKWSLAVENTEKQIEDTSQIENFNCSIDENKKQPKGNVELEFKDSEGFLKSILPNEIQVEDRKTKDESDVTKTADSLTCSICELKFSSTVLLRQHRETHRGRLHACYACRFSSHKAFDLIKHLLEADHQEIVCSLCFFEAETPEKLKEHLKMHNHPKPFFCSICNNRFHNRAALNTHTPKHSTEMPYSCTVCNRAFKWKQGLQSHMTVHAPEKKHLCSECGFSTAYQSTFRAHALVHTSNMFMCQHSGCTFKTVRKQNFVSHLKTHTKEKPYQCEICGQSYSQAKNLRRHAVKHDAVAEEFLERCPLCLYQTMRLDKLKMHFKKHHPDDDESLLNLQRRKRRMLSIPVQRENKMPTEAESNKSEVPATERLNVLPAGNFILLNDLQMSQDVSNANPKTFIITGFDAQDSKPSTTMQLQRDPVLSNKEVVILFEGDNSNAFVLPSYEKFLEGEAFEDRNNESLLASTCINPKLLSVENDCSLKISKDIEKDKSEPALCLESFDSQFNACIDEPSALGGRLISEQFDETSSNKEEPSLDVINNNVIEELFQNSEENSELSTNMLDILSKDVDVGVLAGNKDQMLLCHETMCDDAENIQQVDKVCNDQVLQTFESFESILESL
ncbi:hypothetical protein C0J52_09107 [Blattella germanica]|nr:hypothetical protein C0J52_09107 [Blattella germanica]